MSNLSKKILFGILLVVVGGFSLGLRGGWETVSEFDSAEKALNRGEMTAAVLHFEKVVLWDFPFFDYKDKALKGMEAIKQKARSEKNPVLEGYARDALAFVSVSTDGLHRGRVGSPKDRGSLPNHFWSWMVGISLLTWIGATFFLILGSFNTNLTIKNKKRFFITATLLILVFFFWIYSIQQL